MAAHDVHPAQVTLFVSRTAELRELREKPWIQLQFLTCTSHCGSFGLVTFVLCKYMASVRCILLFRPTLNSLNPLHNDYLFFTPWRTNSNHSLSLDRFTAMTQTVVS